MKTVLIAYDEPNLRPLASASIAAEDAEVLEARDGDEAWDLILKHLPDVAILDGQMPGLTGIELTRAIKQDPSLAHIRVIMLTSKAPPDIAAATASGADVYVTKPFMPLELLTAVEQAFEGA